MESPTRKTRGRGSYYDSDPDPDYDPYPIRYPIPYGPITSYFPLSELASKYFSTYLYAIPVYLEAIPVYNAAIKLILGTVADV